MSKIVIEYDTYFEIKNGLFYPDVPDAEFTFTGSIDGVYNQLHIPSTTPVARVTERDIADAISYVFGTSNTSRINSRDIVLYGSAGASEDFNRLMELELQREREEILRRQSNPTIRILPNMSEQELIEYFDRISQEEEN